MVVARGVEVADVEVAGAVGAGDWSVDGRGRTVAMRGTGVVRAETSTDDDSVEARASDRRWGLIGVCEGTSSGRPTTRTPSDGVSALMRMASALSLSSSISAETGTAVATLSAALLMIVRLLGMRAVLGSRRIFPD